METSIITKYSSPGWDSAVAFIFMTTGMIMKNKVPEHSSVEEVTQLSLNVRSGLFNALVLLQLELLLFGGLGLHQLF